jgi:hypothetical protein
MPTGNSGFTTVAFTAGNASYVYTPAAAYLRVSASLPQSHSVAIEMYGKYDTEVKVLPQ